MNNNQPQENAGVQEDKVIQDTRAIQKLLEVNFSLPSPHEMENQQYSSFNEQILMIKRCSMVDPGVSQPPDNIDSQ